MRVFYSLLFSFFLFQVAVGQLVNDSLLQALDREIEKRPQYVQDKITLVEGLKQRKSKTLSDRFDAATRIYTELKSFKYDSAFLYATRALDLARKMNEPRRINQAKLNVAFILTSSGFFHEALDTLQSIKPGVLSDTLQRQYFYLVARTCYDLADYSRDSFFGEEYATRANTLIDSVINYIAPDLIDHYLLKGLRSLHLQDIKQARDDYEKILNDYPLDKQQFAVVASTLSFLYYYTNDEPKAKEMLIRAAIADIQSSTKETLALMKLAETLYAEGNYELAYRYVRIAKEDVDYYGARHRQVQVGAIYPLIEGKRMSIIETNRNRLLTYSLLSTVFLLSITGLLFIIYKQNKKLKAASDIITRANESLTEINHQLVDANKIKEEYIWYYFNATAEHISKLDSLKKSLEMKLLTKKLEELKFIVDNINVRHERDELYHNFDKVFLKLFPDFVKEFNSLFKEEDRILLKEGQLMNTELRIFALIRMGIHDHERIAKILDYSVTTIYTYKTRLRNKSILENDVFDDRIMKIRAI